MGEKGVPSSLVCQLRMPTGNEQHFILSRADLVTYKSCYNCFSKVTVDFGGFISLSSLYVLASFEKKNQTLERVFHHDIQHLDQISSEKLMKHFLSSLMYHL